MSKILHGEMKNIFLGLDDSSSNIDTAKALILPVPYEQTVSYRPGTRNGPSAIIEASRYVELYDPDMGNTAEQIGIGTLSEVEPLMSGPEEMCNHIYTLSSSIIKTGKMQVLLGGEHSVSVGAVKAHSEIYPDISVLQFDAHTDLRESYWGTRFSHACAMKRIRDYCKQTVHVGIRSLCEEEDLYIKENNIPVFFAKDIIDKKDWYDRLLNSLTDTVYITFDLDSLDPSIMPAVGTPEPGGLLWYETLDLLHHLSCHKKIIGFDIVELSPLPAINAPDFLAAKLVYKLLGYIFNTMATSKKED